MHLRLYRIEHVQMPGMPPLNQASDYSFKASTNIPGESKDLPR